MRRAALALLLTACVEVPETRLVVRDFGARDGGAGDAAADGALDAASDAALPDAAICDATPEECQFGPEVQVLTAADVKATRLVLAVDCGPAMDEELEAGTTRRAAVNAAVGALLDRGLDLEIGLVLFDGRVRRVAPVDLDAMQEDVRAALAVHGTGEGRDWSLGLRAARDLFEEREAGTREAARAVVLFTAGPPDAPAPDPTGAAVEEATGARATLFAVNLGIADDAAFGRLAGGRVLAPADTVRLTQALSVQVPAALPCAAGPLSRRPEDGETVRLFARRQAGAEMLLPVQPDPAMDPGRSYTYDADANLALLSPTLCQEVREGAEVVVRMGPP